jgi:hypothetical protein
LLSISLTEQQDPVDSGHGPEDKVWGFTNWVKERLIPESQVLLPQMQLMKLLWSIMEDGFDPAFTQGYTAIDSYRRNRLIVHDPNRIQANFDEAHARRKMFDDHRNVLLLIENSGGRIVTANLR